MTTLTGINTYPIKSCAGLRHTRIEVQRRGLAGDRRWLIVDANHRFVTGRQFPSLVRVRAAQTDTGLKLSAPGLPELEVARPEASADGREVQIWRDAATARYAGDAASRWLSDYLGADCSLVYQDAADVRGLDDAAGASDGDQVSFADGYPLLLIGSASLADLNRRLGAPVVMERFRTNLVAATDAPYAEDAWRRVRIGDCEFDVAKRCSRCVFTTVDPMSGAKDLNGEPLNTLRGYRLDKTERGVMFGVNLIPRKLGHVEIGQAIEPL